MSKAEILTEFPKLHPAERGELLAGLGISDEEAAFLEREWRDYEKNPEAGCSWSDVAARLPI
jgi:hypothetical protein